MFQNTKWCSAAISLRNLTTGGSCIQLKTGGRSQYQMPSYQHVDFHHKDNTVWWQSYFHNGQSLSGTNLYIETDPLRSSEIHWITDASRDRHILLMGILIHETWGSLHWNEVLFNWFKNTLMHRSNFYNLIKSFTEVWSQGFNKPQKQHWCRWLMFYMTLDFIFIIMVVLCFVLLLLNFESLMKLRPQKTPKKTMQMHIVLDVLCFVCLKIIRHTVCYKFLVHVTCPCIWAGVTMIIYLLGWCIASSLRWIIVRLVDILNAF